MVQAKSNLSSNDVLLLLSGGADSAACLRFHLSRSNLLSCVFIDYGQLAAPHEYKAAKSLCKFFNTDLKTISMTGTPTYGQGLIMGRNAFLLSTALMSLEGSRGLISIGIHSDTDYADCSLQFLELFQSIADLYSDGAVQIVAPFLTWTKGQIINYCIEQDVPLDLTYSCETGSQPPCGDCRSCCDMRILDASHAQD
jgi:7-cyano-7-deazaguanine synthase